MLLEEIKVVVIKQGAIVKGQRTNLVLALNPTTVFSLSGHFWNDSVADIVLHN